MGGMALYYLNTALEAAGFKAEKCSCRDPGRRSGRVWKCSEDSEKEQMGHKRDDGQGDHRSQQKDEDQLPEVQRDF